MLPGVSVARPAPVRRAPYLALEGTSIPSIPTKIGALTGLTTLFLGSNALTAVPTEIAALTALVELGLEKNQLTGVPAEFRTVNPLEACDLSNNPGFTCANVGAETSCCLGDEDVDYDNNCGEGLPGGPCYAG